jgi:hypothetical protein
VVGFGDATTCGAGDWGWTDALRDPFL